MELTLSTATTITTLFSISKTLRCSTAAGHTYRSQLAFLHSGRLTNTSNTVFRRSSSNFGLKSPFFGLRSAVPPVWCRLFASSSSGDGEVKENPIAGGVDDVSVLSSDVIILDVKNMMCGGCAASVKRMLENQAQVSSANVDHTTETAIVWPVSDAKAIPNWQKVMGEELAKHLTNCGFSSNVKGEAASEGEPS